MNLKNRKAGEREDWMPARKTLTAVCSNCGRIIGLRCRRASGRAYWLHENSKGNKGKGCKQPRPAEVKLA